jgi:hypothetical protein
MKRIAFLALTALIATPALADKGRSSNGAAAATSSPATEATSATKDEPKICRRFENTASRLKAERLCMTKEQWRKFEDEQ